MTIAKSSAAKLAVAFVAVAMALTLVAPAAQAQTEAELQAQIDQLLATIASLQAQMGGSTSGSASCPTLTQPMTVGAQGAGVTALQTYLIGAGFSIPAGATGYFGAQTQSAVAAWQSANGVSPAAGYWGPVSLAKYNTVCTSAGDDGDDDDDDDSTSGDLEGGEASLEDYDAQSGDDDEVAEGAEDVMVMDVEFDVEDGDVEVNRVDVAFSPESTPTEADPWDVFENIAIYVDGDKIADVDASDEDDWSEDEPVSGDYTMRLSGLDWVVREGETAEFTVAVTAAGSVDGAGSDANWDIYIPTEGIRAEDSEGIQNYAGSNSDTVSIDITEEGGDDELNVSTSSDDPDATTLQLDADEKSDWITVHAFDLDTDDSENDITVDHLFVNFVLGGGAVYSDTISDLQLVVDGEEFDDWSFATGTTGSSTFDADFDLDKQLTIDAGDEVTVEVQVKFLALTNAGDTITAKVSATNRADIDAEGADDLGLSQLSGSSSGETHTLRSTGVVIDLVSTTETFKENSDATTSDNEGVFTIKFDVTAFEDDLYIKNSAASGTSGTSDGVLFVIENSSNAQLAGTAVPALSSTADLETAGSVDSYVVEEGETETFTLTIEFDPTTNGLIRAQLYGVVTTTDGETAGATLQQALPASDFETEILSI